MAVTDFFQAMTWQKLTGTTLNDEYENAEAFTEDTINGYIGSRSNIEQFVGGKWTVKIQYKFYCDEEVNHGDIITYNSKNYRVIADCQNTINLGNHYKTYVERLENIT